MTIARLTEVLTLSNTQIAIEAAATVAFALSGLIEAARKRLDVVGIFMVMGLTAFGGVLRDMVCNEIPRAFRDHQPYAVWSFVGGFGERRGERDRTAIARAPVGLEPSKLARG